MQATDGKPFKGNNPSNVDWDQPVENGPVDRGFDYYFGISASLDMPPYIYIENDHFVGKATATKAFNRKGPAEPDFEAIDVLPMIGKKAAEFISEQDAAKPFFAYIPLASPHTPILPSKEWQGKSELGKYGDFVMQTDAIVGEIVAAIDKAGFADNTLVIMTSDNGCSKAAGIEQNCKRWGISRARTCVARKRTCGTVGIECRSSLVGLASSSQVRPAIN